MTIQASLSKESAAKPAVSASALQASGALDREVLRVTNSAARFNVSKDNPDALNDLGKALAGSLDRDNLTYFDPELRATRKIGDVLVSVDLSNPEEIVLLHKDSAGKGALGRLLASASFIASNPMTTVAMKVLGTVADPEVIYKQKVIQILSQLDCEGLFGPLGNSTFNLSEWDVTTRGPWRDVVIRRHKTEEHKALNLSQTSFSENLRNSFSALAA